VKQLKHDMKKWEKEDRSARKIFKSVVKEVAKTSLEIQSELIDYDYSKSDFVLTKKEFFAVVDLLRRIKP